MDLRKVDCIQNSLILPLKISDRYRERGNIEAQFFSIQAKLKANGQKLYTPPEGQLIHDIESAWIRLEKAEHEREVALRDEMIRYKMFSILYNTSRNFSEDWILALYKQGFPVG